MAKTIGGHIVGMSTALEAIAASCLARGAWIISDEIHCDLLLDGAKLSHTHYALDRSSRKAALVRFLTPRPEAPPALSYGEPGLQAPRRR